MGIGFGILMRNAGYGVLWVAAMSIFIYAGSMQYVGVGLIAGGASVLTTIITTIMVNARHLFYSISMIGKYKDSGKYKPYLIFALTDETYSLLCEGTGYTGQEAGLFQFLVSLFNHCYWVTGSVIGSVLGAIIPFNTEGIDFALTALFVTVFVEQWLSTKKHGPALVGVGASVVCLLIFGADSFLIPAMALITIALTFMRKSGKESLHE